MNKKLFCAAISVLGFVMFIAEANAQCVRCNIQSKKFVCAPGSTGGTSCMSTGTTCAIDTPCGAGAAQTSWKGIVLEEWLVTNIERAEPHFAKALSFLRQNTEFLTGGYAKIYVLPEVTENPEPSVAPKAEDTFSILEQLDERERNASSVEPAIYEVTLYRAGDSGFATLRVQLLSQKPNDMSSSLIINLMKAERGKWRASGWDIRLANN